MPTWRNLGAFAIALIAIQHACAEPAYNIAEAVNVDDCFRVTLDMSLSGEMRVKKGDKTVPLKLEAKAKHAFQERVLLTTGNLPCKVARVYDVAQADLTTGAEFFFSKGDETTIGRADPVTGILPDIDLTSVDANRSVSRRHAKIICSGNQYFMLEEVGTVNGTYVNDQRIPTGTPVAIHNGDAIKIGLIAMKAVFD